MYVRIRHMKRTTLFIDEGLDHELHAVARRKGMGISALVRESITRYLADQKRDQPLRLRFLGRGRSGRKDISARHEEIVWEGLGPHGRGGRRQR